MVGSPQDPTSIYAIKHQGNYGRRSVENRLNTRITEEDVAKKSWTLVVSY